MKNLSKRITMIAATLALVVVLGICMTACGSQQNNGVKEYSKDEYISFLTDAGFKLSSEEEEGTLMVVANGDEYFDVSYQMVQGQFNFEGEAEDVAWMIMTNDYSDDAAMVYIIKFNSEDLAKTNATKVADFVANLGAEADGMDYVRVGSTLIMGNDAGLQIVKAK